MASANAEPVPLAPLPAADPLSWADANIVLKLDDIRALPNGRFGDIYIELVRKPDGSFDARSASADYNQRSDNRVEIESFALDADRTLKGRLRVTIGPDTPRPRTVGFPNPADVFVVDMTASVKDQQIAHQAEPMAFMPPWRRDEPRNWGGIEIAGTYEASRTNPTTQPVTQPAAPVATKGVVVGAIAPAPKPGTWGVQGNLLVAPVRDGAIEVVAKLSPTRVQSGHNAFAVYTFDSPQDWSRFDALRISASSPSRRDDVAIALRVDSSRGTGYVRTAALLRQVPTNFTVDLTRFGIDRRGIRAVAIGVDDPHGVGDVAFTVHAIEPIASGRPAVLKAPVRITVDPTRHLVVNGVGELPKGLFGFHDVGESDASASSPEALDLLRTTRPGLLRPLTHTPFTTKPVTVDAAKERLASHAPTTRPAFVERADAADALDGVVWTYTQDLWNRPGWMDDRAAALRNVENYFRDLASRAWTPDDAANPVRRIEFWNEPFMWARHTNMGSMQPANLYEWTDPTQHGYLPGKLGADAWSELFLAAKRGASAVNPHLLIGGPSAPEFHGDDFAVTTNYLVRILKRVGDKLDFITEHHYGGDPRTFAAGYEVVNAWCDVNLNRRIPIINTESNDLGASGAGKAAYNIEDILTSLNEVPDVLQGRALHALWSGKLKDEGELHAYTLLGTLRGAMVASNSSDDDVIVSASINDRTGNLVVVALNRASSARPIEFATPAGFTAKETLLLLADAPEQEQQIKDPEGQPIPAPPAGATKLVAVKELQSIPARSAVRWTFSGKVNATDVKVDRHYIEGAVLVHVPSNGSISGKVKWRGEFTSDIRSARLRIVAQDVHDGEGTVLINGTAHPLPYSSGNDGSAVIQEIAIDPKLLTPDTTIEFRSTDLNGYHLRAAAIITER